MASCQVGGNLQIDSKGTVDNVHKIDDIDITVVIVYNRNNNEDNNVQC